MLKNMFIDSSDLLYLQENVNSVDYHMIMMDRILNGIKCYADKYDELCEEVKDKFAFKYYGQGGREIGDYGYYTPTQILDKWLHQFSRGRLLKQPPKRGKVSFVYYYDDGHRLIMIEGGEAWLANPQDIDKTFLLYEGNEVLYLTYFKSQMLNEPPRLYSGQWVQRTEIYDCFFNVFYSSTPSPAIIDSEWLYKHGDKRGICYRCELITDSTLKRDVFEVEFGQDDVVVSANLQRNDIVKKVQK